MQDKVPVREVFKVGVGQGSHPRGLQGRCRTRIPIREDYKAVQNKVPVREVCKVGAGQDFPSERTTR